MNTGVPRYLWVRAVAGMLLCIKISINTHRNPPPRFLVVTPVQKRTGTTFYDARCVGRGTLPQFAAERSLSALHCAAPLARRSRSLAGTLRIYMTRVYLCYCAHAL